MPSWVACRLPLADHDPLAFDGLSVVFISLGTKGDSTLVIFPNERTMLVDGGLQSAYPNIKDVLNRFGVEEIDAVVATHPDQDHVAGLISLLADGEIGVHDILVGPVSKDTATYAAFLAAAGQVGVLHAGDAIHLDPDVSVLVLSPPEETIRGGPNASVENSNSVVLLITYGDVEFLLTADTTHATEAYLLENWPDSLDVDIMGAPHHGSKHASTSAFIRAASPGVVVFSANLNNQYGHPHGETVARYAENGVPFVSTVYEDVAFQTDGTDCSVMYVSEPDTEVPCFDGVGTVPEFGAAALVIAGALIPVIIMRRAGHGVFWNNAGQ